MPTLKPVTPNKRNQLVKLTELFKSGDLLFGLNNKTEEDLAKTLKKKFTYVEACELNTPLVKRLAQGTLTSEYIATLEPTLQAHAHFLLQHKDYLLRTGGTNPWPNKAESDRAYAVAIRRACKLLITHSQELHKRIYLLLDGVDMERVCTKKAGETRDPSITSGEIRAAFRAGAAANVCFIQHVNKEIVVEKRKPWEDIGSQAFFATYEQQRQRKKNRLADEDITPRVLSPVTEEEILLATI